MLFKEEHVEMIKNGFKTQTRRNWKRRMVKPGGVYKVKTVMLSKDYHCKIRVSDVYKELLGEISTESAIKEGYSSIEEYKEVWKSINGSWDDGLEVYVIDFELYGYVGLL